MKSHRSWFVLVATVVAIACADEAAPPVEPTALCPMGGIGANPTSASLHINDTLRLRPYWLCVRPSDTTVYWESGNPIVATVDTYTGLVHARALSSTTVIVRLLAQPYFAAGSQINVLP